MNIKNIYKFFLLIFVCFQTNISLAQTKYGFIPKEYVQMSEEQLMSAEIVITPDVLLFTEKGKLLSPSDMQLLASPLYSPVFFADTNGNIKALVLELKKANTNFIEKNPEAQFEKGERAKDFIATDLKGNRIKLSELQGKVVVLNFWFIKCKPCVMEMPHLNELKKLYKSKEVVFLAVTFDKIEMVEQFLEENNFDFKIAANAHDVINIYGINSFPTNMVINQKGEIVLKELGFRTNIKEVLKSSIDELLK